MTYAHESDKNIMNINYEYYKIFYEVAVAGSFTKAAEKLYSNQPNVTRTINRLEDELDCILFERSKRGVTLTPDGEELFKQVKRAVEHINSAEKTISEINNLNTGVITVGASETALHLFLNDKLRIFHEKYPGIRLRILNITTPVAIGELDAGHMDLAVVTTPSHPTEDIEEEVLSSYQDICVCGNGFFNMSKHKIHFDDLVNYPLIMTRKGSMTYEFYHDLFLKYGKNMEAETEVTTNDLILPLVKANLGISFVPQEFISELRDSDDINKIELYEKIPSREIVLMTNKTIRKSKAVIEFIKTLKE